MNNKEKIVEIESNIKKLIYFIENDIGTQWKHEVEIMKLTEKKEKLTIISNDGLDFNFVKQFNSECDQEVPIKTIDDKLVNTKMDFRDNIITKYDKAFNDCACCKKSKTQMEVQVYNNDFGAPLCFNCFEQKMRDDFISINCDFEIDHLADCVSSSKFQFSYNNISIEFDEFSYRKNKHGNRYTILFYIELDFEYKKEIGTVSLQLTETEINFLKSQYGLIELENTDEGVDYSEIPF